MKKLIVIFAFMASVINLGFANVSENELKALQNKCFDEFFTESCEKLCDLKDGNACISAAYLPYKEEAILQDGSVNDELWQKMNEHDKKKLVYFLEKACESKSDKLLGDVERKDLCYFIAEAYYNGGLLDESIKLLQDYSKALYFYEIACEAKHSYGCYTAGWLYKNEKGVEKNFFKAKQFYEKACHLKYADGCNSLGVLYENGQGTRQDFSKAFQYYKIACDLNSYYGCNNLAWLYHSGQGVKSNKAQAKELFGKACDLGFQTGCDNYKEMLNPTKKNSEKTLYDEFLRKRFIDGTYIHIN